MTSFGHDLTKKRAPTREGYTRINLATLRGVKTQPKQANACKYTEDFGKYAEDFDVSPGGHGQSARQLVGGGPGRYKQVDGDFPVGALRERASGRRSGGSGHFDFFKYEEDGGRGMMDFFRSTQASGVPAGRGTDLSGDDNSGRLKGGVERLYTEESGEEEKGGMSEDTKLNTQFTSRTCDDDKPLRFRCLLKNAMSILSEERELQLLEELNLSNGT